MEYQNAVHVDSLEGISGDVNEEDFEERVAVERYECLELILDTNQS